MTKAEARLWSVLRGKQVGGIKFRRQFGIGPYIVDFFSHDRQLVIEIDGDSHGLPGRAKADARRENYLETQGVLVIRFTDTEVFEALDEVVRRIAEATRTPSSSP
jgi:very-short-patch-repair endonuclease